MEGSEAGSAERDGGVHHPQQECHHGAHLPRSGAHGQCETSALLCKPKNEGQTSGFLFVSFVFCLVLLHNGSFRIRSLILRVNSNTPMFSCMCSV